MLLFKNNSNSRDQQIAENTKDIAILKELVGQVYMTPLSSGIPDGTIADPDLWTIGLADTDLPSDIELGTSQGYVLTSGDSKLFKLVNVRADAGTGDIVIDLMYLCDIQGKDGERGADGQDGQNATSIELGTVTSGDEASATLTPVGDGVYVLDLVLPRGEQGETGATGEAGADGLNAVISGVTATIDSGTGTPDIDVVMSGTPQNRTFNFDFHNLKGADGTIVYSTVLDPNTASITIPTEDTNIPADTPLGELDGFIVCANANLYGTLEIIMNNNVKSVTGIYVTNVKGADGTDGKGFSGIAFTSSQITWESTTNEAYPYKAFLPIPNLTVASPVIVNFQGVDVEKMIYAPYCTFSEVNGVGGVYIYTTDNTQKPSFLPVLYYIAEGS